MSIEKTSTRRWFICMAIWAVVTAVCFATTAPERLVRHTSANHFALLADAWLHGRLDLGAAPPAYTGNNDFAFYQGKHYISFPPFPAVLLLPAVKAAGGAERVSDGRFFCSLTGIAPALLFLALERLRISARSARSELGNVTLALLFAFGTVYWFSAVQGEVWFAAHVVGAALAASYLYASLDARHPLLAGLSLGLGFATRTPLGFAFPLFVLEAMRAARHTDVCPSVGFAPRLSGMDLRWLAHRLVLFALPAAAVLAVLLWHNHARFGDPFEFGHRYLTVVWRARMERWGLFSFHYFGRNLGILLTSLPYTGVSGAPFQINAHGLALWLTTPIYVWALWPKRTGSPFFALGVTALFVALPNLFYQNSGWVQFGYRFSNDFAVFLFAMIALGGRRFGVPFWLLAAWSLAINAFGALSFHRKGYEHYYFLDRTQKILHQPD